MDPVREDVKKLVELSNRLAARLDVQPPSITAAQPRQTTQLFWFLLLVVAAVYLFKNYEIKPRSA